MTITQHPFANTPDDFQAVWDFLTDLSRTGANDWGWDFCRFEWWYYRIHALKHADQPAFFTNNLHLWRAADGALIGISISEYGDDGCQVILQPQFTILEERIFRWLEENWVTDQKQIETYAPTTDGHRQAVLRLLGYKNRGHCGNHYGFDLAQLDLDGRLPEGFTIRDGRGGIDVAAKIALVRNAFEMAHFPRAKFESTLRAPSYDPQLDLTVVSDQGAYAAYCMGWVNRRTKIGAIEPVGTHSDFRRRGLASAMIRECCRRMQALGVTQVWIGGDNPLYESLAPAWVIPEDRWVKKLSRSRSRRADLGRFRGQND